MIIGEAVARIHDDYKKKLGHINWRKIKDFRNIIVHDSFGIDSCIVQDIIRDSLPELQSNLTELLSKEKE
jgi:uncharacterized protein with HEPN domain